jgi:hypothetical protein
MFDARNPHSILGQFLDRGFSGRIAGSQAGGLKIGSLLFRALQIAPPVPRYTN